MVGSLYEEILVELQGEAGPVAHHPCLGKREDDDDENRGIEQQQEQPQIALAEYFLHHFPAEYCFHHFLAEYCLHHLIPPSCLLPSPAINVDAPMRKSMMSERAAP